MSATAQTIFRKKSRSFSLAARLFTKETRKDVARLYQFCRYVDDLADDSVAGEPERLNRLKNSLNNDPSPSDDPVLRDFLGLSRERSLPLDAAIELLEASIDDCGPVRLRTEGDLIRFAYGVAGTVGLLMCPLLGVDDARATPFAIDLGIALQLTNIARDVAEDAGRQRFYLPAEWIPPDMIQLALNTKEGKAVRSVDEAVERTLQLADRHYESALSGLWFIPIRNRRAIFFALNFYRGIGEKMRDEGSQAWQSRTRLGLGEKVAIGLRAWPRYRELTRRCRAQAEAPEHDHSLHQALRETKP